MEEEGIKFDWQIAFSWRFYDIGLIHPSEMSHTRSISYVLERFSES